MTPDFHITQKITSSDYRRYCNVCGTSAKKHQQKQEAIMLAIGLIIVLAGYFLHIVYLLTAGLCLSFISTFMLLCMWPITCRNHYLENPMISQDEQSLSFDQKGFMVKWHSNKGRLLYKDLQEILEDEKAFYLMAKPGSGQIVIKKYCSSQLIAFLHAKAKSVDK
ncbi:MAG: YcxB family protein [Lactimicrobium sp.]|jgi:hypothetical protein|uniref:YcxB family protein n=1 Tax=Lactimicrobium sp. TaxID=2563780 RepID=UPI002F35E58D